MYDIDILMYVFKFYRAMIPGKYYNNKTIIDVWICLPMYLKVENGIKNNLYISLMYLLCTQCNNCIFYF